ncbi:MAG: hypothetical protein J6C44_08355 [Muribaculaceae bacterium]|nr:hypothetical protein [Muribaculaceae bacterium]
MKKLALMLIAVLGFVAVSCGSSSNETANLTPVEKAEQICKDAQVKIEKATSVEEVMSIMENIEKELEALNLSTEDKAKVMDSEAFKSLKEAMDKAEDRYVADTVVPEAEAPAGADTIAGYGDAVREAADAYGKAVEEVYGTTAKQAADAYDKAVKQANDAYDKAAKQAADAYDKAAKQAASYYGL